MQTKLKLVRISFLAAAFLFLWAAGAVIAQPLPLASAEAPPTGLYTLQSLELYDPSGRTNWTVLLATNSGGSPIRTILTDTKTFTVTNLAYPTTYYFRGASGTNSSIRLTWNASPMSNVAYRVYVGTNSRVYNRIINVGSPPATIVPSPGVTNYLAVTLTDAAGLESVMSEEVSWVGDSGPITLRLGGTTNAFTNEFKWPPVVDKYVKVTMEYFSASLNQWVLNYEPRLYTNILGNQFWRYRKGDRPGSPTENTRAWQQATSPQGPWLDIPATLLQNTNAGPIRFQITNWPSLNLSQYQIPE